MHRSSTVFSLYSTGSEIQCGGNVGDVGNAASILVALGRDVKGGVIRDVLTGSFRYDGQVIVRA